MKMTLKSMAIATATFACAALFSPGWSEQGGVSLSVGKAEAHRLYVGRHYAVNAVYVPSPGLSWYAVRAYYFGGPWSGPGYSYTGWPDYAARNGIACTPGTIVPGGDGILYNCQ
jgi:hypothetical protein